jgi:hypothetical protein
MGKPSGRFIDMRSEPDHATQPPTPAPQSPIPVRRSLSGLRSFSEVGGEVGTNHRSTISSSSVWILHSLRIRDDRGGIVPTGDRPYLICAHLTFLAQPKKMKLYLE